MNVSVALNLDLPFPLNQYVSLSVENVLEHGKRVANYCHLIALELGLETQLAEELKRNAIFHDIGKLLIPRTILNKPCSLTPEEFKRIQAHPLNGYAILQQASSKLMRASANLALKHHENLDGSGYPYGLKEKDLAIEDRIIRVADTFDAITSWRPYRKSGSISDALLALWSDANTHFDCAVIGALESVLEKQPNSKLTLISETQIDYVDQLIHRAREAQSRPH